MRRWRFTSRKPGGRVTPPRPMALPGNGDPFGWQDRDAGLSIKETGDPDQGGENDAKGTEGQGCGGNGGSSSSSRRRCCNGGGGGDGGRRGEGRDLRARGEKRKG